VTQEKIIRTLLAIVFFTSLSQSTICMDQNYNDPQNEKAHKYAKMKETINITKQEIELEELELKKAKHQAEFEELKFKKEKQETELEEMQLNKVKTFDALRNLEYLKTGRGQLYAIGAHTADEILKGAAKGVGVGLGNSIVELAKAELAVRYDSRPSVHNQTQELIGALTVIGNARETIEAELNLLVGRGILENQDLQKAEIATAIEELTKLKKLRREILEEFTTLRAKRNPVKN
jgi:hypothetical protein